MGGMALHLHAYVPTALVRGEHAYVTQCRYSPYAEVFVKSETTPKNTVFNLLYLNHHNSPTIENLVADIQLILEQLGAFTYQKLIVLKTRRDSQRFWARQDR